MPRPTRRDLLTRTTRIGLGAGLTAMVSACGSSASTEQGGSRMSLEPVDASTRLLIPVFQQAEYVVAGPTQRTAFALGLAEGGLVSADAPDRLIFELARVHDDRRSPLGDPVEVTRHDDGVPVAYYPIHTTYPETGTYVAVTTLDGGGAIEASFGVVASDTLVVPQPGGRMPALATPTFSAPLDVDPICTRDPQCPLHEISLDQALAAAAPTVLLVSTPAFCQIGVCGPVLDLLLEAQAGYPEVQFIHCEVFRNENGPASGELVEAVESLGLTWEPSLFAIGADGTLQARLDNVFDRVELNAAIAELS